MNYVPRQTTAHSSEDVPTIRAIQAYLADHTPEQLLRCVASAAIESRRGANGERIAALDWLATRANDVADGKGQCPVCGGILRFQKQVSDGDLNGTTVQQYECTECGALTAED